MIVLALNSGSSSLKFGLYRVSTGRGEALQEGQLDAVADLASRLVAGDRPAPQAIGHRIVHGGPTLRAHTVIDAAVLLQSEAVAPFAPLHTPASVAVLHASKVPGTAVRRSDA